MSSPNDLTTLDNVKLWLNDTTTDDDALLARLITAVSSYIQTWLNRSFAIAPYSETRDGGGKNRLMCSNYPVTSVESVIINGQPIPVSTDINTPGFYFDEYKIGLRGYCFVKGYDNVAIAYHAGYAAVPPEIEQACIETIALRYTEKERIGYASKSLAGETVSFTIVDFPKSVMTILNNYKKVISLS